MIFISGANGFIGRHLVRRCAEVHPALPLRVLLSRNNRDFTEQFPAIETVCADLGREAPPHASLQGTQTLVHLASKNIDNDGNGFAQVNVEGTRQLCRHAVEAGIPRFIYISSVGVYGHGSHRDADESTQVRPDTAFSRSKAEAEKIVLAHHAQGDFQALILRHRFVYGEQDRHVIPRFIKAARRYPFWIDGGRAKMSLLAATDFAAVIERLATLPAAELEPRYDRENPVYHATDGMPIAYREMITTICELFGFRPPRFSIPFPLLYYPLRLAERLRGIDPEVASGLSSIRLKFAAQDNYFSNRKLCRLLPEMEFTPFRQGLEKSFAYYRDWV